MKDTKAVQQIAQQEKRLDILAGIVRDIRGQYIDVLLDGGRQIKEVGLARSITTIQLGWWVLIVRTPRSHQWIAIVTFEDPSGGSRRGRGPLGDIPQPGNVAATATGKPYFIELSWSGCFKDKATYEVQHNSSASETGATMLKVEGSNYFYWCAPGTQRYFRVRAVTSDYERSSWSDWVNATSSTQTFLVGENCTYDTLGEAVAAVVAFGPTAANPAIILVDAIVTSETGGVTIPQHCRVIGRGRGGSSTIGMGANRLTLSDDCGLEQVYVTSSEANRSVDCNGKTNVFLCNVRIDNTSTGGALYVFGASNLKAQSCLFEATNDGWGVYTADTAVALLDHCRIEAATGNISVGLYVGGTSVVTTRFCNIIGDTPVNVLASGATWYDMASRYDAQTISITGTFIPLPQSPINLDGRADALVLDSDGDTTISAPTDDQIDVKVGGAVVVVSDGSALASRANIVLDDGVGDSPQLQLVGGSHDDTALIYLDDDAALAGASDVRFQLPGNTAATNLIIQDSGAGTLLTVRGDGAVSILGLLSCQAFNATHTSGPLGTYTLEDATTDTVSDVIRIAHFGGAVVAGFGSRVLFQLEDGAGGLDDAAYIDVIWDDAGAGSEDSRIAFGVRVGGAALAEIAHVDGAGLDLVSGKVVNADTFAFRVKNTSGAAAAVGDVGYTNFAGEYKTTTTQYSDVSWCVVITGGANNADIYVAQRGRVIVKLDANCSVGDYLYTSGTATQATPQSYTRPELFAVALTANGAGAGGTCEALLLTGTRIVPYMSSNFVWYVTTHTGSNFAAKIDDNAGAHGGQGLDATHVPYDTITGNKDSGKPGSAGQLGQPVLHNTTRGNYRLVTANDTTNNYFTTVNSVDNWADNDDIQLNSLTCDSGGAPYFYDLDLSQQAEIPKLARFLQIHINKLDTGAAAQFIATHPYVAFANAKQNVVYNQVASASVWAADSTQVSLLQQRFCWRGNANAASTARDLVKVLGYGLAIP